MEEKQEDRQPHTSVQARRKAGAIAHAIDVTPNPIPFADEEHGDKKKRTPGWRIHNELTYRGIDWLLNSSVGVAFAYWSSRTPGGKKHFQEPVSKVFKTLLTPILENPTAREEGAKWGTMFAGIMAGGFTIIPPMMVMENKENKKKIVRWLDEKIYGPERVVNDPSFAECYRQIDEEPEKNFATGMISRLMAIAPLIAITSYPKTNKPLIKYLYDPIGNKTKLFADKLGIKPSAKMLTDGALEHLDGDPNTPKQFQNNWDFLHRTIGFDFGLTIFYAMLHELAFKATASMCGGKKQNGAQQEPETIASEPALKQDSGLSEMHGDAEKPCWKKRVTPASTLRPEAPQSFRDMAAQQSDFGIAT